MARTVTVIGTQTSDRVELNSSARTWGELRREIDADGTFSTKNFKAMVRGSRTGGLDSDSAELPDTAFSLFLNPSLIKSGSFILLVINNL
jgi:hypothetical protein